MSGPKSSVYTLTATRQRILAEERRKEIERQRQIAEQRRIQKLCKEEREKISVHKKDLSSFAGKFTEDLKKSEELFARTGKGEDFSKKVDSLENFIRNLQSSIKITDNMTLEELQEKNLEIIAGIAKVKAIFKQVKMAAQQNNSALISDLEDTVSKGFNTSFAELDYNPTPESDNVTTITEMKINIEAEMQKRQQYISLSQNLQEKLKNASEFLDTISDGAFLKNFSAVSIIPLLKECDKAEEEYQKLNAKYESLLTKYQALCKMLKKPKEKTICSEESIAFLQKEIKEMEMIIADDDEQSYISDCIDEVMSEMGYIVLGARDIQKKSGKRFHNDLYSYSDGTAVNVTYSEDGKISMELGGLDEIDRIPNETESYKLCEDMEDFCDDFSEIEKRLAKKGVILKDRLSMLPPTSDYAQIINTSDYKMIAKTENLAVKSTKSNYSNNKKLRKEI